MAGGKFSQPRPHRDEERQIEQAFRQVTGQAPKAEHPIIQEPLASVPETPAVEVPMEEAVSQDTLMAEQLQMDETFQQVTGQQIPGKSQSKPVKAAFDLLPENLEELLDWLEEQRPALKTAIPDQTRRAGAFHRLFDACNNPELLKGMLRPVFRYARTDGWKFDFAPHDVGQYPLVNGQVYGENALASQMPVEECGNMIILTAAICKKENDPAFALENLDLISVWNEYLVKYGADPGNQLCTDDFAGHLAHNCNLAIKAIMGIAGYSSILTMLGREEEATHFMSIAREYADTVCRQAKNPDGSYRLAYDREGTFSLKYNAVWDKLWGTNLFPDEFYRGEIARYRQEALPYGVPLDSREKYTKSDWLLWAACLADNREDFNFFVDLLWKAYHTMRTRVPMTDWYFVDTSEMVGFQHRTVQGGLFLKLLFN